MATNIYNASPAEAGALLRRLPADFGRASESVEALLGGGQPHDIAERAQAQLLRLKEVEPDIWANLSAKWGGINPPTTLEERMEKAVQRAAESPVWQRNHG